MVAATTYRASKEGHPMSPPSCYCGQLTFRECCAPLLARRAVAATAEQLMRSRYTAFAVGDERHLLSTWDERTRPPGVDFEPDRTWLGLSVLSFTPAPCADPPAATVEFEARYQQGRAEGAQHEVSRFVRGSGGWVYVGPVS